MVNSEKQEETASTKSFSFEAALSALSQQITKNRNLWNLYVIVAAAVLAIVGESDALERYSSRNFVLAGVFVVFAFLNISALVEGERLENALVDEVKALAKTARLASDKFSKEISNLRPKTLEITVTAHILADLVVTGLIIFTPWK